VTAAETRAQTGRRYRIEVRGLLGARFHAAFPGLTIEAGDGRTTIEGVITDQTELHGVLARVRDLGLDLVRLEEVQR
jgi:hypothetical protein